MNCLKRLNIVSFVFFLTFTSSISFAENWQYDSIDNQIYTNSGKVGIGTSDPKRPLHISSEYDAVIRYQTMDDDWLFTEWYDSASIRRAFMGLNGTLTGVQLHVEGGTDEIIFSGANRILFPGGKVGIGTSDPKRPLHISSEYDGVIRYQTMDDDWCYTEWYDSASIRRAFMGLNGTITGLQFHVEGGTNKILFTGGNVGINTSSPDPNYKLDVNGSIKAKEIKVTVASVDEVKVTNAQWSDFVFEENYKLPSLDHVESYIKENKHLPDVPSAEQIAQKGLSMAGMMAKQMQKIEELTLYVIELKKENAEIKNENINLRVQVAKVSELEARISSLEKIEQ